MTTFQRLVLALCALILFGMILVPPWADGEYALIFSPHSPDSIDFKKLILQSLLIGVAGGALFVLSKPSRPSSGDSAVAKESITPLILSAGCFGVIFVTALGWYGVTEYLKFEQQRAKAVAEAEEHRRESIARASQANTNLQQLDAELKGQAQQAEHDLAFQQQKKAAESARFQRLAVPKDWNIVATNFPRGTRISADTYWNKGTTYLKVKLFGTAESLEYGIDKHPLLTLSLVGTDGLVIQSIQIDSQKLEPFRNSSGAIIGYSSQIQGIQMDDSVYENLGSLRLQE